MHNISSRNYYDKYLRKKGDGACTKCGNVTNYINISKGYFEFCSSKCSNSSMIKKEKIKQTNLRKYGVEYPSQNEEVKRKMKRTYLMKYGVEHVFWNKEIREKRTQTNLKKFGFETPFQNKGIKEKIKLTNLKKYGVENQSQNEKTKEKKRQKYLKKFIPVLDRQSKYLNLELLDEKYFNSKFNHKWKCLKCGYEFKQTWNIIQQRYKCPNCYPKDPRYSKGEKELVEFIKLLNLEILENDKYILDGKELDIYIPSKKLAIEFNGLYWHSERNIEDKNYHLIKTEECQKHNIRLIHIFEDEWILKQSIIESKLKQILGISKSQKIYARKCQIKEILPKIKNEFLNKFHLQGEDKSSIKLGAFYKNELISVMTFSKGNISKGSKNIEGIYELNRFCSNYNYHIPGIASKLLTYFKRNYEWKKIFSYADRRWSKGNLYYKLGFELEKVTKPNYWYVKGSDRIHRFNLRKHPNEPKDIPEQILRLKEGYYRIWDCGHYKFIIRKEK